MMKLVSVIRRVRDWLNMLAWLPPLVARLTIGSVFITSGWGKLHHLDKVTQFFQSLGIPWASFQAPFASGTEFVCGILVLAGLMTRAASVPLIVIMIVAICTARAGDLTAVSDVSSLLSSFDKLTGFIEYLYIALLLWLVAYGPGVVALDALIARLLDRGATADNPAADS